MSKNKIHYSLVFLSFLIPFLVYFKTMAPTVSLWDCGEFIATSIIMGIPHPPGTPLYLIIGNFFSQLPIVNDLGARVNLISPIASALSITFLYLIIVYLIEEFNKEKNTTIYYAAFIGALTFAVTDSQWFNAVEAEVYALSTLFTAIVVWLILKWSKELEYGQQVKYLILIFYCMGLAIGIHLLNLLAIPFIALIIFFKYIEKYDKKITYYNWSIMSILTGICFLIIYKGIIKGLPSIINKTQDLSILFIFFIIILITTIITNINLNKNYDRLKYVCISIFAFMFMFITMNELLIDNYRDNITNEKRESQYQLMQLNSEFEQKLMSVNNIEAQEYWIGIYEENYNEIMKKIETLDLEMNNIKKDGLNYIELLSKQTSSSIFQFILSLALTLFLLRYLYINTNRTNYFAISQIVINCMFIVLIGYSTYTLIFIRAQQDPQINYNNPHDIKSAYEYINRDQYGQWDILDRKTSMLINSQQNHESWKRYTKDINNPKSEEITRFVWNYQFKEMYLRYFAWQFIGKEKWGEKTWSRNSIDNKALASMPPLQGIDSFRYGIPFAFLIGIFGLFYHFRRDSYRALSVLSLFILTGLAIVVYLNQSDPQPRERDYAFVGSFFAFSIWIGIGSFGLIANIKKKINNIFSINRKEINTILAIILFMVMPMSMGITDYYEHDRSKRFEAWDYAYNLLNSCDLNGILFTNGDNDTFPLWYLQYVEKIRTDVKVVNLSLLNFPSYIKQLDKHTPSLKMFKDNDEYLNVIDSENIQLTNYANNYYLNDKYPMVEINTKSGAKFNWEFKNGTYGLGLTNITIMKIIEECYGERPIYFSVTTGNNQLGLDDYLIQEGLVYKLTNQLHTSLRDRYMNLEKTMFLIDSIYQFRNLNENGIFYGPHIERIAAVYRNIFQEASNQMVVNFNQNNNIQKSFEIREKLDSLIPNNIVPEMEQMITYRTWEYYETILGYCAYMHKIEGGISYVNKKYLEEKFPDLHEYIISQYPEFLTD